MLGVIQLLGVFLLLGFFLVQVSEFLGIAHHVIDQATHALVQGRVISFEHLHVQLLEFLVFKVVKFVQQISG